MYILKYKEFILESIRQNLYHFTHLLTLELILKDKGIMFQPNDYEDDIFSISTTRNHNFKWGPVRITLNTDKIMTKYSIKPVSFFYKKHHIKTNIKKYDQQEEIIISKNMGYLPLSYIDKIEISTEYGYTDNDIKELIKLTNIPILLLSNFKNN